jgi:TRAP-type C4-dicarboxylate transport system substrate-binding protein
MDRRRMIGSVAASLAAPSVVLAQAPLTLKFHTGVTANSDTWRLLLTPWMDKVTAESQGRLKFERYPSMQLGGTHAQLYDQVRDGVVDVTWTLPGYSGGRFPRSSVFELPFFMTDPESTSRAYYEFIRTAGAEEFKDVQVLALHVSGPGVLHSRSKAVERIADLKGMKVRTPSRQVSRLFASVGATPVGLTTVQLPDALSKGTVDAAVLPWQVVKAVKADELTKFHTEFPAAGGGLYTTPFAMVMNRARYAALPPDLKAVIDNNSGLEVSAWAGKQTASTDPQGRAAVVERGNRVLVMSDAEAAAFVKAAAPLTQEWIVEMKSAGLDGQALYDSARRQMDRYTGRR